MTESTPENPLWNQINWTSTPLPEGCSLRFHDICASEKDFSLLLQATCNVVPGKNNWNGDPKSLRWPGQNPFVQGYYAPFAQWSSYAPYPVIHLCGTTLENWRDPYVNAIEKEGFLTAWAEKIDPKLFLKYEPSFVASMLSIVWGSDILIYRARNAGRYSQFERDIAQYYKIPVYDTEDYSPQELSQIIHAHHFPVKTIPIGTSSVFEVSSPLINKDLLVKEWWNTYGLMEPPTDLKLHSWGILTRRAHLTPWGPMSQPDL